MSASTQPRVKKKRINWSKGEHAVKMTKALTYYELKKDEFGKTLTKTQLIKEAAKAYGVPEKCIHRRVKRIRRWISNIFSPDLCSKGLIGHRNSQISWQQGLNHWAKGLIGTPPSRGIFSERSKSRWRVEFELAKTFLLHTQAKTVFKKSCFKKIKTKKSTKWSNNSLNLQHLVSFPLVSLFW